MLTVEITKGKCRFASFPEVPNWGMVLADHKSTLVTQCHLNQRGPTCGLSRSQGSSSSLPIKWENCSESQKSLHHSLKTFMLEAAVLASWYSGCWTSIAVSQISYPTWKCILYQKKIPGLQSLFIPYEKYFHTYLHLKWNIPTTHI